MLLDEDAEFEDEFDPNVEDEAPSHYYGSQQSIWVCEIAKPEQLIMLYTGDNVLNHQQDGKKVSVEGDPEFEPIVHIVAVEKKLKKIDDLHKAKIYFEGDVNLGETFSIDATNVGKGKLRANTYVYIFDLDGRLLQTIQFHTSCSQPLVLGNEFGGIQLVGFIGENGETAYLP